MDAMSRSTNEQALTPASIVIASGRQPQLEAIVAPVRPALASTRLDAVETVCLTKAGAGSDRTTIDAIGKVLRTAEAGGGFKFLVIDFTHREADPAAPNEAIQSLVLDVANLILKSAVVTIAVARGPM